MTTSHTFISYSTDDSAIIAPLVKRLNDEGINTWIDENIHNSITREIEEAIEAADNMLVFLSPNAKQSDWVRNEITYARIQEKPIFAALILGNRKTAIPVHALDVPFFDLKAGGDDRTWIRLLDKIENRTEVQNLRVIDKILKALDENPHEKLTAETIQERSLPESSIQYINRQLRRMVADEIILRDETQTPYLYNLWIKD